MYLPAATREDQRSQDYYSPESSDALKGFNRRGEDVKYAFAMLSRHFCLQKRCVLLRGRMAHRQMGW